MTCVIILLTLFCTKQVHAGVIDYFPKQQPFLRRVWPQSLCLSLETTLRHPDALPWSRLGLGLSLASDQLADTSSGLVGQRLDLSLSRGLEGTSLHATDYLVK